jgi:TRAP-type transport system small permease protein
MMKLIEKYNKIIKYFVLIITISMVVITDLEIVFRYIIHRPLIWPVEITTFLLGWLTFVGAGYAIMENEEIIFKGLARFMPKRINTVLPFLIFIISLIFLMVMFVYGIKLALLNINKYSYVTGMSMAIPYLAIPIGVLIMLINKIFCKITNKGN